MQCNDIEVSINNIHVNVNFINSIDKGRISLIYVCVCVHDINVNYLMKYS